MSVRIKRKKERAKTEERKDWHRRRKVRPERGGLSGVGTLSVDSTYNHNMYMHNMYSMYMCMRVL